MAVESDSPYLVILKDNVKSQFGKGLNVHSDFELLADDIRDKTKANLSSSTLERIWNYSTRGYRTVSHFTLDLLCKYCGYDDWEKFCSALKEKGISESEMFDEQAISKANLSIGDRLRLSWPPDRVCEILYLGEGRFIVEKSTNAKLLEGDTFSSNEFLLHRPFIAHDVRSVDNQLKAARYEAGTIHGLTSLQIINV